MHWVLALPMGLCWGAVGDQGCWMGLLWAGGSQECWGLQEEQHWWLCLAWVPRASRVPLGKPRGLPGVSILACTAPGCPAEVPVVPDPCWQQERWPVKVACVLPAVHGCSCAPLLRRTLGTGAVPGGSLCQGGLCATGMAIPAVTPRRCGLCFVHSTR